jgi:hypothetical protein
MVSAYLRTSAVRGISLVITYVQVDGRWWLLRPMEGEGEKPRQIEMMNRKTTLFRITILFFITNISICL